MGSTFLQRIWTKQDAAETEKREETRIKNAETRQARRDERQKQIQPVRAFLAGLQKVVAQQQISGMNAEMEAQGIAQLATLSGEDRETWARVLDASRKEWQNFRMMGAAEFVPLYIEARLTAPTDELREKVFECFPAWGSREKETLNGFKRYLLRLSDTSQRFPEGATVANRSMKRFLLASYKNA